MPFRYALNHLFMYWAEGICTCTWRVWWGYFCEEKYDSGVGEGNVGKINEFRVTG